MRQEPGVGAQSQPTKRISNMGLFDGLGGFNPFGGFQGGTGGGFGNGFLGGITGGAPNPFGGGTGFPGFPQTSPFGGGIPGLPQPPNPFGGGGIPAPPNPFGGGGLPGFPFPNPFANPYGSSGSQPNPSPWNGINPYGTQVSGGNTNPWSPEATGATYRPGPDPYAGTTFNSGFKMGARPNTGDQGGDLAGPYQESLPVTPPHLKQATQTRWGGGIGVGGPFGFRQQESTAANPQWHDVKIGMYKPGMKYP